MFVHVRFYEILLSVDNIVMMSHCLQLVNDLQNRLCNTCLCLFNSILE